LKLKHFTAIAAVALQATLFSCSSPPAKRTLSMTEQIAEDNQKARDLVTQFEKKTDSAPNAENEKYLTGIARRLALAEEGRSLQNVQVRIHQDKNPAQARWFSFPGTVVSIPQSFLRKVQYENELAAGIAFELANILGRHLARKMESGLSPILFGDGSIFELDRGERAESIQTGTKLLYYAGYDLRGMASVFQRYPDFFGGLSSKKEVEFNVKESQKIRSGFLPARDAVVRSTEFIRFKKRIK
jgi:predicted Zn-dependent protease